jgi:hypothetical protein
MTSTASSRARGNVQVPGEPPVEPVAEPVEQKEPAPAEPVAEPAPSIDVDALREQIRAEERAKLLAEAQPVQSATVATGRPAQQNRGAYRNMRASEVDHTKLTAPVLTLDGWVCPPPAEKV